MQTYIIGFIIRRLREINGMTQSQLATKSDTDPSWLSSIENGHGKVSMEKITQIASGLGVPMDDLMHIYHIQDTSEPGDRLLAD